MLLILLVFFLVLSVLVLVHELGHFLAAKKAGIKVEEFGFGLPPRIFGVKKGETIYSINWLPIGGFVKLYGEDEADFTSDGGRLKRSGSHDSSEVDGLKSRAFYAQPKLTRAIVLLAGVLMNFLLAVLIISYIFTQGVLAPTEKVAIKRISQNSPAQGAGLKVGDIVLKVNGVAIKSPDQLISVTGKHLGEKVTLEISRCPTLATCYLLLTILVPRQNPPPNEGAMGLAVSNLEEKKFLWYQAPFSGTVEAFKISGMMIMEIGKVLWKLITFQPVGGEVSGPIGIAQATGEAVKFGPMAVLQLMGLLSLNLAVVNILPFPALDGGRLLFVVIEGVLGKKVKPVLERMTHQIGMVILLGLIFLVTLNDLLRIFKH